MKEQTEITEVKNHQKLNNHLRSTGHFSGVFLPFIYFRCLRIKTSLFFTMFSSVSPLTSSSMQQVVSIWVRDPRLQKNDFWHAYIDYEICLHTTSVCFTKKISCVRRRYSEFVWFRQKLKANSMPTTKLPDLPPKNPFFSLNNAQQITERMVGLQKFLEEILQDPLLLSDSCLHLFLQTQLSVSKIEACAAGRTHYSVVQAVQGYGLRRFHSTEDLQNSLSTSCDSDSDSSECREPQPWIKDLATAESKTTSSLDLSCLAGSK